MAVGQGTIGTLYPVDGVRTGTVSAGIKKAGRRDVVVFEICKEASVAGVYTKNAFCAAPVQVARRHSGQTRPSWFLVNTGNANAGTGEPGLRAALKCCEALAARAGCELNQVLPFSTGVIGEPLPVDKITAVIPSAISALAADGWLDAAHGIMTTDTRPKAVSRQMEVRGKLVTITGIAKGAGMIKPNMATMLSYIATDAAIGQNYLQELLEQAVEMSFNRISVDGDTSTNDCCMLVATGRSGVSVSRGDESVVADFRELLNRVCVELAQGLVRDAEGATKFVSIRVEQGSTYDEALRVAYTVAESPLVKTALFASDPNWGRILAAVGRAGLEDLAIEGVEIYLGDVCIVSGGGAAPSYTEEQGAAVMAQQEIPITIRLGRGSCTEQVWTADFSYDYVKINAEYRS